MQELLAGAIVASLVLYIFTDSSDEDGGNGPGGGLMQPVYLPTD